MPPISNRQTLVVIALCTVAMLALAGRLDGLVAAQPLAPNQAPKADERVIFPPPKSSHGEDYTITNTVNDGRIVKLAQDCGGIDLDDAVRVALAFSEELHDVDFRLRNSLSMDFERGRQLAIRDKQADPVAACARLEWSARTRAQNLAQGKAKVLDPDWPRFGRQMVDPTPKYPGGGYGYDDEIDHILAVAYTAELGRLCGEVAAEDLDKLGAQYDGEVARASVPIHPTRRTFDHAVEEADAAYGIDQDRACAALQPHALGVLADVLARRRQFLDPTYGLNDHGGASPATRQLTPTWTRPTPPEPGVTPWWTDFQEREDDIRSMLTKALESDRCGVVDPAKRRIAAILELEQNKFSSMENDQLVRSWLQAIDFPHGNAATCPFKRAAFEGLLEHLERR